MLLKESHSVLNNKNVIICQVDNEMTEFSHPHDLQLNNKVKTS